MNEQGLATAPPVGEAQARLGYAALLVVVSVGTAAAVVAGAGPLVAILPVLLTGLAYAATKAPLRISAALLIFLVLGVDDHGEFVGQWRTPLATLGDLMHQRMDSVGVPGVAVTGMEVLALLLLLLWVHRRATGQQIDTRGRVPTARVLGVFVVVYVAAVAGSAAIGLAHGQGLVPWKMRNLLHPILLFVFFDAAFRGPLDHRLVGRAVVLSAVVRSLEASVVQRLSILQTGGKFATAMSHGDSILFAVAFYIVLMDVIDHPERRKVLRGALVLLVLLVGMKENGRRLVWVMVGLMMVVTYLVSPQRPWKRWVTRTMLASVPIVALYLAIGWNREGKIFAPIRTLRGVTDTSYDHSAYWREVENWNIAMSMRARPLLGVGLGGRYTEFMFNDDISSIYREYREWPHNTVMGILLLMGLFGFTAVWGLFTVGLFLALRAFRAASTSDLRVAALGSAAAIVACHVLAYGDTGTHYPQYKVVMALALVVAGKLAVATGGWPGRAAAAAPGPA